ncbi:NAD(P)-binding domain-containing protein [Ruania alba]|uniref:Thioredoxin reductase n=1 Tax=Ruania alba TaxID=648782 RepID=A0A1H5M0Z1_9MICO|nr:NAD(P)-binding domain-containing protein [Ruania alba]SEE82208.1 Thioredoxin reductase [Ruania alba]
MDPVVIVGAGPQGLAAAAHLLERDVEPLVLEAGPGPAAAVHEWAHVRLFSPWPELIDGASRRLLEGAGWSAPDQGYPTGGQWVSEYLAPLAAALGNRVRYSAHVVGVGRKGRDLSVDSGREDQPFVVHIETPEGEERIEARAVIDASGTWSSPNPAGADGLSALGERDAAASGMLTYRIPDVDSRCSGRHTVVIGNGHSAATAVANLARVARRDRTTRITWVLRRGQVGDTFGGGQADELPERGALGQRAKRAVESGLVRLVTGFRTDRIDMVDGSVIVSAEDGRRLDPADHVVALTGFRPDHSFLSEVRLELDLRLQAPRRVAMEVDPNIHSCGSVAATGATDLAHPEPGFYIVGAKSYGRAPTFLALTGFEQVRSVVAKLAGDDAAAERVELDLPDTGVCGGAGLFDEPEQAVGCCTSAPQPISLEPAAG